MNQSDNGVTDTKKTVAVPRDNIHETGADLNLTEDETEEWGPDWDEGEPVKIRKPKS